MDSLPQELIDTIIDGLPLSTLLSSSLAAKRWRRRSQQRAFGSIKFLSEAQVNRWCTDVPQDPEGIISYIHVVRFQDIFFWDDPATFGRALENLSSLTKLWMVGVAIPNGLPGQLSRGQVGESITILCLWYPCSTLATMASLVISLPNLEVLSVVGAGIESEEPLSPHPVTSQRAPLRFLDLRGNIGGIGKALAESRFVSHHLSLDIQIPGVEQLIAISSETAVNLALYGVLILRFFMERE